VQQAAREQDLNAPGLGEEENNHVLERVGTDQGGLPSQKIDQLVLDSDVLKRATKLDLDEPNEMTVSLDPEREEACRARLRDYLTRLGDHSVEQNVEQLFTTEGGFVDRFIYMSKRAPSRVKERLLVSGCSVGSEMIVARRYGYKQIVGVETSSEHVDIARDRLRGTAGFEVVLYDGNALPYPDGHFSAVVSGHIIEHTPSPFLYLREHMRVLKKGGIFFLEFPDRYHPVELHTNLPSAEAYPLPIRSLLLRYRGLSFWRYSDEERRRFTKVRKTLQPVSLWQIRSYLVLMGLTRSRIIHQYQPLPGYQRMLIMK
jgi:SAM-dependent methyltransferase